MGRNLFLALALLLATPLAAFAQTYPAPSRPVDNTVVAPCIQSGAYASCLPSDFVVGASGSGTAFTWSGLQTFNAATTFGSTITTPLTGAGAQCLEANASGVIIGTGAICGGSGSAPGGANTNLQYNASGVFAGTANFTISGSGGSILTGADSATWTSGGLAGLVGLQMGANRLITWGSAPFGIIADTGSPGSARFDFRESSTTYAALEENSGIAQWIAGTGATAGTGAYCFGLSVTQCMWNAGSTFSLGATRAIFNFGSGTTNDASGQIGVGIGLFSAKIGTPDGGALGTAINQFGQPIVADPLTNTPSNPPANPIAHTIGVYPVGDFYLGAGLGGLIAGSGAGDVSPVEFSTCMASQDGFPNLCFEMGSSGENHKVTIGYNRVASNAFGTNTSALFIGDLVGPANSINSLSGGLGGSGLSGVTVAFSGSCTAVADAEVSSNGAIVGYYIANPGINSGGGDCSGATVSLSASAGSLPSNPTVNLNAGNKPGPGLLFNAMSGQFVGIGQDNTSPSAIVSTRLCGAADNYGAPGTWDDRPSQQPTCGMPGGVAFGTGTNVAPPGGTLTYTEQLRDAGGTNILALTTPGISGTFTVGLKTGFIRMVPVTVAGLATADASPLDGDSAYVTDATSCTFNGSLTGSGSTHCRVHYDGSASAWKGG